MSRQLQVISGPDKGRSFSLTDDSELLLGRSAQTQSQLADRKISRVHCQVEVEDGKATLTDLDSHGGTYVNGKRVQQHVLNPGDVIQIGATQISYLVEGEALADHTTVVVKGPIVVKPDKLPAEQMHELTGRVISHYDLGPVIAKGATGLLFQARDFKDDRTVGLMVLFPEYAKHGDERRQFIAAMKTRLPLDITISNIGKTGPYCWIAVEYAEGKTAVEPLLAALDGLVQAKPEPSPRAAGAATPKPATRRPTETVVEPPRKPAPRHETVVEPPRKPAARHETVVEPPRKPAARHETVVEPPRKPVARHQTVVEPPQPGKTPAAPTDTKVELHRPRPRSRDGSELNPPLQTNIWGQWSVIIIAVGLAFLAGIVIAWVLLSRS
jgi:pSer/pThr/pTyr-binding forkhead associated (FHA) protein